MASSVVLNCTGCGVAVELPAVPDEPGYVSIEPMEGWECGWEGRMGEGPHFRLCPACAALQRGGEVTDGK